MAQSAVLPPSALVLIGDQRFEYRAVVHDRDLPVFFLPPAALPRRTDRR